MPTNINISDIPEEQIIAYLEGKGYTVTQNNLEFDNPLALISSYPENNETGGKPPNSIITLRTEREYGDWGKSCISVTHASVQEAFKPYPSDFSNWRIIRSHSYETVDQLKALLERLTKQQKAACWG